MCVADFAVFLPSYLTKLQALFQEAVVWKRLVHENIVPFLGVNLDPLQLISEWVTGGDLSQYVNTNPSADRIGLVGCGCHHTAVHQCLLSL